MDIPTFLWVAHCSTVMLSHGEFFPVSSLNLLKLKLWLASLFYYLPLHKGVQLHCLCNFSKSLWSESILEIRMNRWFLLSGTANENVPCRSLCLFSERVCFIYIINIVARKDEVKYPAVWSQEQDLKMENYDGFLLPALCIQNAFSD